MFENVNPEDVTDEVKAVYLRGLHEALSTEGGKAQHASIMPVSGRGMSHACTVVVLWCTCTCGISSSFLALAHC